MNKNILFKVMLLLFGLVMVFWFRQQMGSQSFKEVLASIFGPSQKVATLNWCADHVVDFKWTEVQLPAKILEQSMSGWREDFCQLETEPIENIDLATVSWSPLAESSGATGQKAVLEWNREFGLFKSGGLPFKSSKLAKELSL